jgi:NAD(P)-dependent dehydrogenase (short-subunit alcohol dehydrogenase family)
VALRLAQHGLDVVVHYHRSFREAQSAAKEIRAHGVDAYTVRADLSRPREAEALIGDARKACGRPIDVLINNASSFPTDRLANFSPEQMQAALQVNAIAPLQLMRAFARQYGLAGGRGRPLTPNPSTRLKPGASSRGRGEPERPRELWSEGSLPAIVNFLDTTITRQQHQHVSYNLAKRALNMFTQLAAIELAPVIRVNGVAPGAAIAPSGTDAEYFKRLAQKLPLKRTGGLDEIGDAILFLLHNRFVTGQVIFVDSGWHLMQVG